MHQMDEANALRAQWAQSDAVRDTGITPADVRALTDIAYTESETEAEAFWHLTDIYYPKQQQSAKYPVIVNIHGGGWFYGDKQLYSLYTKYMAAQGFAVVNFNYRLAPEYRYPCGFLDVCRLMHFVARNAECYHFDPEHLYLTGDSAGAQLASQYAIYATSDAYRGLFPETAGLLAPVPAMVALNCGIYEIDKQEKPIADWYLPAVMTETQTESAYCILDYLNRDFPATYLMVSVNDGLMPRSRIMKQKLEQLQIPLIYREFGQQYAANGHVFHLNLRSDEGRKCITEELAFFRDAQGDET